MKISLYCPECNREMIKDIDYGVRANYYCEECDINVEVAVEMGKE